MNLLNSGYNLRWERSTSCGVVRYYETKIQLDLFGQLILEVFWGRKGTKFVLKS